MSKIHPTAIVDAAAEVADDVEIGPYCCIGPRVTLKGGVVLHSHVVIDGITTLGENCQVFPFAAVGLPPQDLKYRGEDTRLTVGARTIIRENATLHPGTAQGRMATEVGEDCLLMVGTHVAHDCQVGNHVIMANNATLAGHVVVGDHAILGGLSAIHQYCRIGRHAMVGGMSGVENDVIPYGSVLGNRAYLSGLNVVGLKRRNFSRDQIHNLRAAYRLMFAEEGTMSERLADVAEMFRDDAAVMEIVAFIQAVSSRAICQPQAKRAA